MFSSWNFNLLKHNFPFISLAFYPAGWDGARGAAARGEQHAIHAGHASTPAVGHHAAPALGYAGHVAHAAPTVAHMAAVHQVVAGLGSTGMHARNSICVPTHHTPTYLDYPGAHMCPSCRCHPCMCLIVHPPSTHHPFTPAHPPALPCLPKHLVDSRRMVSCNLDLLLHVPSLRLIMISHNFYR
jgi:hypothetical protein